MTKTLRKISLIVLAVLFASLLACGAALLPVPETEVSAAVAVKNSALPSQLEGVFTNFTCTELSARYRSEEALETLQTEGSGQQYEKALKRAGEVLRGEVKYEPDRAFSTAEDAPNRIAQYGDVASYSDYTLKWHYCASDLLITGIYGLSGDTFRVYVEAEEGARLPSLILTRAHADYRSYRSEVYLYEGLNEFTIPDYGAGQGGPVYLKNPYTPEEQGGEVSLYVEGGGFYPVFEKGGDVAAFRGELQEFETKRLAGSGAPDVAELVTDFAFITTTASSLYTTYITYNAIDPEENMELWGDLFTKLYEFNGIATSPDSAFGSHYDERNRGVRINLRYMQEVPNSGAYAYRYHIGFYKEHYWFANFYNQTDPVGGRYTTEDYSVFAMGHEIGHMLDADGRTVNETTNNMTAAYTYLRVMKKNVHDAWIPYTSFERLVRDSSIDHKAYDNGKILYQTGSYDHNYMIWWFLECCFPDYWAQLNNMYRFNKENCPSDSEERMVYYSSLITGVDLGPYFDRWGLYLGSYSGRFDLNSVSEQYRLLMAEAKNKGRVSEAFDRFYYADNAEFDFIRNNEKREYAGEKPSLTVKSSDGKHTVSVSGKQDDAHLGYEVRVSTDGVHYSIAGFTRTSQFTDTFVYPTEPTYKAVAVNRFFAVSEESEPCKAGEEHTANGACRIGEKVYGTLLEAIGEVPDHGVISLLADCSLSSKGCYRSFTLEVDESVKENIKIYNTGNSFLLQTCADIVFRGREEAHIVLDGGSIARNYASIFAGSYSFTAEYVDFAGCIAKIGGGAVFAQTSVTLRHCAFENCTGKEANALVVYKDLTLEDCTFRGEGTDIYLRKGTQLSFRGDIPAVKVAFEEGAVIRAEGFTPDAGSLSRLTGPEGLKASIDEEGKITFLQDSHTLTFCAEGEERSITACGRFTFGGEELSLGQRYIYEYVDAQTGERYRAGESIYPARDMCFTCTLRDPVPLTLLFLTHSTTASLRADERLYLPHFDGAQKISCWATQEGERYPAGGSASGDAGALYAVYEGYFRYDFLGKEGYLKGGYAHYGESISLPEPEEEEGGWYADGKLWRGTATLTADTCFTACKEEPEVYDLTRASIVFEETELIYSGKPQCPAFRVELNGKTLPKELYTALYSQNINAGYGRVTVEGIGAASGTLTANFLISPRTLTQEEVSLSGLSTCTYTGSEQRQIPTLKVGGELLASENYQLEYSADLVNAGTVKITVTFCGNYAGKVTAEYSILQADHPEFPPARMEAKDLKTLGELRLPAGWAWENGALSLEGNGTLTAAARYCAEDAANYREISFEVLVVYSTTPAEPEQPDPEPDPPVDPDPDDPGNPQGPEEPEEPEQPEQPEQPSGPQEPQKPEQPEQPEAPSAGCGGELFTGLPLLLLAGALLLKKRRK